MRNRVFTLMRLRSRSNLPSAIPIPRISIGSIPERKSSCRVSNMLSGATEKIRRPNVLPPFPETEDQGARREELDAKQLTRPAFDLSAEFTHPDKAIMDVLSDFVAKHRGSPTYSALLMKLLTSARLRELGVGYNVIPIPDKQEWKASWHEEGKPNWLGTILTDADGKPRMFYTASISGYIEKDGRKGGYGVILFDHYGRPKVASVGVSLKGNVPLIYYELQGVRSALKLAFDHGFGVKINLYCNSDAVRKILNLCLDSTSYTSVCMGKGAPRGKLCTSCVGLYLYGCRDMEDFGLLFPVITEILVLFNKINNFTTLEDVMICRGSCHLAKHFTMSTTEEEISQFVSLVDEFELYEMVMKPDEIPEEVDDSIYDEVFKGNRVHSSLIMAEKMSKANEYTHPRALHSRLRKFSSYEDPLERDVKEFVKKYPMDKALEEYLKKHVTNQKKI